MMTATPAWPPKSAPRLFVEQTLAAGTTLSIEGSQAHYLSRVMRVGIGDAVMLCDDCTGEWIARVSAVGKRDLTLTIEQMTKPREAVPDFWLCATLIKKPNFDLVLEKATELGVAAIHPLLTQRCVADKLNPDRARAILIEAAEQCARTALPLLAEPRKLDSLLDGWSPDRTLFFADENGGKAMASAFAASPGPAALLIGPEGGFADQERARIRALPAVRPISLGPRILRAETAAIAATACWMATNGDWTGCERK